MSSALSVWSTSIGMMAYRKKCKAESRLHSVKIVVNDSEEPVLLEEDPNAMRYAELL